VISFVRLEGRVRYRARFKSSIQLTGMPTNCIVFDNVNRFATAMARQTPVCAGLSFYWWHEAWPSHSAAWLTRRLAMSASLKLFALSSFVAYLTV
jgi:hypothetical protein